MRNGLLAVFLIVNLATAGSVTNHTTNNRSANIDELAHDRIFAIIDTMLPTRLDTSMADRFTVQPAIWIEKSRTLHVSARTNDEKGTLLSLTGLPESTMIDTFAISTDHFVQYEVRLDSGRPVPCRLVIGSAFQKELVDVVNAPISCARQFQISGSIPDQPIPSNSQGTLNKSRIVVTINNLVFETFAGRDAAFDLKIYNDSADEMVNISIDNGIQPIEIYAGSLNELLQGEYSGSTAWAAEILGRRHTRLMLASRN